MKVKKVSVQVTIHVEADLVSDFALAEQVNKMLEKMQVVEEAQDNIIDDVREVLDRFPQLEGDFTIGHPEFKFRNF